MQPKTLQEGNLIALNPEMTSTEGEGLVAMRGPIHTSVSFGNARIDKTMI